MADRNGNVYRQDRRGNLQQRRGNQWSEVGREQPARRPEARPDRPGSRPEVRQPVDTGRINRELQARQRGEARSQNFQRRQNAPDVRRGGGGNVSRPAARAGRRGDAAR